MAIDILVKYQPRVVEHFDIKIDAPSMFLLIQTLRVAVAELEVDAAVQQLLDALVEQYDQSSDGQGSTREAVDGDGAAA